jgi:hypothetical protein
MNTLKIDKKSYAVVPIKEYENLLIKAASKVPASKKLSLAEGKKKAYKLIDTYTSSLPLSSLVQITIQVC